MTVPADIWLNIEGNRNYSLACDSMGYSHDVEISNLTGNKEFTIEVYNEMACMVEEHMVGQKQLSYQICRILMEQFTYRGAEAIVLMNS